MIFLKILVVMLSPVESNDSATLRTKGLIKGLLSEDCSIDYLTIPLSNCHNVTNEYNLSNVNIIRTSQNKVYDSIVTGNSGILKKIFVSFLRKIYHTFSLYDYTYSIAKNLDISILPTKEYDIVISSSDPKTSHIAVKNLIKQGLHYKQWIQYWGDPLAADITNKTIYPKWILNKIEKRLLKIADKIVYVSPFTLEYQKKSFPYYADKMLFYPIPYFEKKIFEYIENTIFKVGYYGDYANNVRNIQPLYDACKQFSDKVHLDIIGNSNLRLEETGNISIYPRGEISEYEKNADLLICILNKKGTQIPGKLYHYAATNKPILVLIDGERKKDMINYLESFNRYIICDNNATSIYNKINEILKKTPKVLPCQSFSPEIIAKMFLEH